MMRRIFGLSTRNILFFSLVGIFALTAFIKVPCPVCDGTGSVSTSVNMDRVFFSNMDTRLMFLNPDFCIGYTLYEYEVNVTLTNDASEDATGWVSLQLKAYSTGKVLDTAYMGVAIPAKSTAVNSFTVWFKTAYDSTTDVFIEPAVNQAAVECLTCSGSGKTPLNVWLVARGMKTKLAQITKVERTFVPPPVIFFPPGE